MEFRFNLEKNAILVEGRGIGFEEIISEVQNGNLLAIRDHENKEKYPNQRLMYVRILNKVYRVPFVVEDDGTYFLKTLIPSRKATKLFLKKRKI